MRLFIAILLLLAAAVFRVVQLAAVVAPVGTKMADGADPFGSPHAAWHQHALFTLFIVACLFVAPRLLRRRRNG